MAQPLSAPTFRKDDAVATLPAPTGVARPGMRFRRYIDGVCTDDRHDLLLATVLGVTFCLVWNAIVRQDANFDQRNYHIAGAFRLLHRHGPDIAPAGMQTWFNPLGYVPFYLLIMNLPPVVASAMISAVQGLNAPAMLLVMRRLVVGPTSNWARLYAAAGVCCAMTGALFLSELGTTFLDVILTIPTLVALWLVLRAGSGQSDRRDGWELVAAGALIGGVIGLKLTAIFFAPAFACAAAMLLAWRRRLRSVAWLLPGGALGFAIAGGWWHLALWREYRNPVFPIANSVFASPWIDRLSLLDDHFLPQAWHSLIVYPFRMATGAVPGVGAHWIASETHFRDPRYLVGLLLSAAIVAVTVRQVISRKQPWEAVSFVGLFWLMSFLAWFYLFEIARYVIVLEMLAGGLAVALVSRFAARTTVPQARMTPLLVAAAIIAWTSPGGWEKRGFGGSWFGLDNPGVLARPNTTYLLASPGGVAWVQAFLPADARLVRIAGVPFLRRGTRLGDSARRLIVEAPGPIRTLTDASKEGRENDAAFATFGVRKVPGSCLTIASKMQPIVTCAVERIALP